MSGLQGRNGPRRRIKSLNSRPFRLDGGLRREIATNDDPVPGTSYGIEFITESVNWCGGVSRPTSRPVRS